MPKLQTERASIAQQEREKVLKELKSKPTATSAPLTPTPATPSTTRTTEDIARDIMARLK